MKKRLSAAAIASVMAIGLSGIGAAPASAATVTGSISVTNTCGRGVSVGIWVKGGSNIRAVKKLAIRATRTESGLAAGHSYVVKTSVRNFTVTIPKVGNKGGGVLIKIC